MARMVIVRAALIDRKNDGNNCGVRNYENRFPWNFPLEFPWMEDSDLKSFIFGSASWSEEEREEERKER